MSLPFVVGIAGGSGSGKTTVARRIAAELHPESTAYLDQDSYYLDRSCMSPEERDRINFDHPDAIDHQLLAEHVAALVDRRRVEKPSYDFEQHVRTERVTNIEPCNVIIVEGILLFVERALRDLFDLKIFVEAEADIRLIRRLRRDITERGRKFDAVVDQYLKTVRPMHLEFVEPSKRWADIILPRGGHNREGIEVIAARIRGQLGRN